MAKWVDQDSELLELLAPIGGLRVVCEHGLGVTETRVSSSSSYSPLGDVMMELRLRSAECENVLFLRKRGRGDAFCFSVFGLACGVKGLISRVIAIRFQWGNSSEGIAKRMQAAPVAVWGTAY